MDLIKTLPLMLFMVNDKMSYLEVIQIYMHIGIFQYAKSQIFYFDIF